MKQLYKVRKELEMRRPTRVYKPGADVTSDELEGLNADALVTGGFLEPKGIEAMACPACEEQGVKKPPKFDSLDALQGHYGEKHVGLVPPEEGMI